MIGYTFFALLATGLLVLGSEHLCFHRRRQRGLTVRRTAEAALRATPIDPAWLLDGQPPGEAPRTEAASLAANDDATVAVYLWQTTQARYRWEHASDEVVTVLDGEAYVSDEGSEGIAGERRLGPGDVAFFPAGSRSVWRVPVRLRKVSTLVRPVPWPAASLFRWLRRIKRAGRFVVARAAAALATKIWPWGRTSSRRAAKSTLRIGRGAAR